MCQTKSKAHLISRTPIKLLVHECYARGYGKVQNFYTKFGNVISFLCLCHRFFCLKNPISLDGASVSENFNFLTAGTKTPRWMTEESCLQTFFLWSCTEIPLEKPFLLTFQQTQAHSQLTSSFRFDSRFSVELFTIIVSCKVNKINYSLNSGSFWLTGICFIYAIFQSKSKNSTLSPLLRLE